MKCVICKHGETQSDKTVVTMHKANTSIVIKDVPADICDNCGEYYLDESTTDRVLKEAESAVKKGVEVEILRFVA
ncbi:MAG: type II toxin-antitoxin system MqsA family antitoxin [SAR324 cluster bacterium]|nr:type II toxin-antitoxin system MqsA family antitoxin [SAR324 cluster bacterium]